jgi:ABC-type transport system substrate-binding protein
LKIATTALLVGFVLLLTPLPARGLSSSTAATAVLSAPATELRIGILQSVDSLNPFRGSNEPAHELGGLIYDYLFSFDQDGNLLPNIALNGTPDPFGANWSYTIRQGVTWSDGTNLTASDVNFTINYNIQNFAQLWAFEPYVNRIVRCTASTAPTCGSVQTGPYRITVYFDRPFSAGEALFIPILQKAQWQGITPIEAQYTFDNPNPVGTGPFIADPDIYNQWLNGQPLHLMRNPNYHPVGNRSGGPQIDDLYFRLFPDEGALANALRAGQIDLAEMTPDGIGSVEGQPSIQTSEGLQVNERFNYVGISQIDAFGPDSRLNPARWDATVRRAMAMATNKDRIRQSIYNGTGVRGASLMSPITPQWSYDPSGDAAVNLTYNLSAANTLLSNSGYNAWWTDTSGIPYRMAATDIAISIQTASCGCPDPTNVTKTIPAGTHLEFIVAVREESVQEQLTARFLQSDYAKVGIKLDLKIELESALANDVYGGYVELYLWDWSADPDPNYLLSIESAYTLDGWNDNYWDNRTYNGLYVGQLTAFNPSQREAIVRAAERLHYETAVYLIYLYPFGAWAWRTDNLTGWGNWTAHPFRQPDAYWGANPLFLDLRTITVTVSVSGAEGRLGMPVNITGVIHATMDGTWEFDWGDGTTDVGTFPAGNTTIVESHLYAAAGVYSIQLAGTTAFDSESKSSLALVDGTPPSTEALASGTVGNAGWYVSPVVVTLSASDDLSGVAATSYRINNGSWQSYTGPFHVTMDGWYAIGYNSSDKVGNSEITHTFLFGIDTLAPTTTVRVTGTRGSNGWYVSNVTVDLVAIDAESGVASVSYEVDGGTWQTYQRPLVLGDGTHTLAYMALDVAGNVEGAGSVGVNVDTIPPKTHVTLSGVSGLNGWYASAVALSLDAIDPTSGVDSLSYQLNGGGWLRYSGPLNLGDGTFTVSYRAADVAGNTEAVQSVSVKIDMTPPELQFVTPAATLTNSLLRLSWIAVDNGSGIAGYSIRVDEGGFQDVGRNTSVDLRLADGQHVIEVRAIDGAGNVVTKELTVMVDTNPFSLSGPYSGIPTYGIVAAVAVLIASVGWRRRRKKRVAERRP